MSFRSRPANASNDRRRRLLLRGMNGVGVGLLPEGTVPAVAAPAPRVDDLHGVHSLPSPEAEAAPGRERHGVRSIPELLSDSAPVTWLFIGDSFTAPRADEAPAWMTGPTMFAATVRKEFARSRDLFVDATYPGARISEVLFEFERRVLRFEPDICFLAIGTQEAGSKDTARFEQMMSRLIRWSKRLGCQIVLQSPPCLPGLGDGELTRNLILVEAIRGMAREHNLTLVDHWEHWEWSAATVGTVEAWIDSATRTPGPVGHRQLARRLIRDLNLPALAAAPSPSMVSETQPVL